MSATELLGGSVTPTFQQITAGTHGMRVDPIQILWVEPLAERRGADHVAEDGSNDPAVEIGAAFAASLAPHSPQYFEAVGTSLPHSGQTMRQSIGRTVIVFVADLVVLLSGERGPLRGEGAASMSRSPGG